MEKEQQEAFDFFKAQLTSRPLLIFPDYTKPFHIYVDASTVGRGGALMQELYSDETKRLKMLPIAYWSRVNSASERKWATIQLELSAIVLALRHFQSYIYGNKVIVHSDHRPLIYLIQRKGTHPNLARWAVELMQYDLHIEHVAGAINRVADCLSKIAEKMSLEDVKHLEDAEYVVDFPVSIYMNANEQSYQVQAPKLQY